MRSLTAILLSACLTFGLSTASAQAEALGSQLTDLGNAINELSELQGGGLDIAVACDSVLGQCGGSNTPKCSCSSSTGNCTCTGEGCSSVCTCKDGASTIVCKWVQQGSYHACSCSTAQKASQAQIEY